MKRMPAAAAAPSTGALDTLLGLVTTLRALQLTGRDHPWLALSISMAQVKTLLLLLQTGGMATSGLAERLNIGPSAVTPLVDRLVEQKLVRRVPDANDRRIIRVLPTKKALGLWERLMEANRAVLEEVLREIPAREHAALQAGLQRLLEGAERVMARRRREHPGGRSRR